MVQEDTLAIMNNMNKTAESLSASMEKDQLISMIHFLEEREKESERANRELKDMVKKLTDIHKQDVKTKAYLQETQSNLMKSINNLTNQLAELSAQNKDLQRKVNSLLAQIGEYR